MPLIETESLVLKTYNLAEADRIVLFLTSDHGLVRGVAKGAKRLKSKFGSSLEPFSIVRLSYFQKDSVELVAIENVELLRSYFDLCSHSGFLEKFAYLSDILTALTPPDDPDHDLYRMVKACLDVSAKLPDRLERIGMYFELWLLRLGGYLPDWSKCEKCRRALTSSESATLQANFQVACERCQKIKGGSDVTGNMRQTFASALRLSPLGFAEIVDNERESVIQVSRILRRILSQAIGKDIMGERSYVLGN
jgi:DNA repair protein RecO (recombination protein O)